MRLSLPRTANTPSPVLARTKEGVGKLASKGLPKLSDTLEILDRSGLCVLRPIVRDGESGPMNQFAYRYEL